jgi:TatD DNase family protein
MKTTSPEQMAPELVDTHCHIQSAGPSVGERDTHELWVRAGALNPEDILKRARETNVARIVCVGCNLEDSKLAIAFARNNKDCWSSIGIHPHEAQHYVGKSASLQEFADLVNQPKVVAVGECGLDYFYTHSSKEAQVSLLKFQIELALEYNLPIIFHIREAFDDFWPIFETYSSSHCQIRAVLHSFTDSKANLDRALRHGLFIGVNGIATFTKNTEQLDTYRAVPLDNLLLETDAPFLTPYPYRGKVCEPYHVRTTAEFLAELRGETLEALAEATVFNARRLFGV